MTHKTDLPALPSWQAARHPKRTSRAVQAARTTWRWGCTLVAALLLLCCAAGLTSICLGSVAPLSDLATVLFSGSAAAIPLGWRDTVPGWYVRMMGQIGGDRS